MFLLNPKLTETTYSATVDNHRYEVDITKFPKERATAMAIEEIRKMVSSGITPEKPVVAAPTFPDKRGSKTKSL